MMILLISGMTLLVRVVLVKSKYPITSIKELEMIKEDLIAVCSTIETVLPTLSSRYQGRSYSYVDKRTALLAVNRAIEDTVKGELDVTNLLRYLRRLFIVSGKVTNDEEFDKFLVEMYQLAKYKEVNKDEM